MTTQVMTKLDLLSLAECSRICRVHQSPKRRLLNHLHNVRLYRLYNQGRNQFTKKLNQLISRAPKVRFYS